MKTWDEMKKEYLDGQEKLCRTLTKRIEKEHEIEAVRHEDYNKAEKTYREYDEAEKEYNDQLFVIRVLRNNIYAVFCDEIIPKIAAIWNKYAGKQYGEKTKEKIQNEINDAFPGVRIYAYIRYYPEIHIDFSTFIDGKPRSYSTLDLSFTRYDNGRERFLTENNTIEEMQLVSLKRYIEDVPGYIAEMKTKYQEIAEKAAELEKLGKAFNELTIDGIESVHYTNFFVPATLNVGNID